MKYLVLLFLVLSGCATTNSEYWQGCSDTTKLFIENSNFKQDSIAKFCDAVEADHKQEQQHNKFLRDSKK